MTEATARADVARATASRWTLETVAPVAGLLFALFYGIGAILEGTPASYDATPQEQLDFFVDHRTRLIVSFYLLALAGLFFLVFLGSLWRTFRLVEPAPAWLSTIALSGGIVYVALGTVRNLFWAAGAFRANDNLDPDVARSLYDLAGVFYTAWLGLVAFLLASAVLILRTGVLPRLLGWLAVVVAPLAAAAGFPTPHGDPPLYAIVLTDASGAAHIGGFLLFIALVSLVLLRRAWLGLPATGSARPS
jgi:hypothetical protein